MKNPPRFNILFSVFILVFCGIVALNAPVAIAQSGISAAAKSERPKPRPAELSSEGIKEPLRQTASIAAKFRPKSRPEGLVPPTPSFEAIVPKTRGVAAGTKEPITNIIPTIFAKDRLSLVGIFGKDGAHRALFRTAFGRYIRVVAGEQINGWRVVSVDATSVVLDRKERTEIFEIQP